MNARAIPLILCLIGAGGCLPEPEGIPERTTKTSTSEASFELNKPLEPTSINPFAPSDSEPTTGPAKAVTVAGVGTLELTEVGARTGNDTAIAWAPDGTGSTAGDGSKIPSGERTLSFRFLTNKVPAAGMAFSVPEGADETGHYWSSFDQPKPKFEGAGIAKFPSSWTSADVEIGIALETIHPVANIDLRSQRSESKGGYAFAPIVTDQEPFKFDDREVPNIRIEMALPEKPSDVEWVLTVYKKDGKTEEKTEDRPRSKDTSWSENKLVFYVNDIAKADVTRLELGYRPYTWFAFKDVALKPRD